MTKKSKRVTMQRVFEMLQKGYSNRQVCSRLRITANSLRTFKGNLTRYGYWY